MTTAYAAAHAVIWLFAILAFAKDWPRARGSLGVSAGMFAWSVLLLIR